MKTEHEITVRLLIDATPALCHMLGFLTGALNLQRAAAANDRQTANVPEKPEIVPEKPEIVPEKPEIIPEKPEIVPEKPEIVPEKPEIVPEKPEIVPEAPKDAEPKVPAIPTATQVREAMERVRERIEGPGYADRQGDPKAKALHRALTAAFKNVSATFGAAKPSELEETKRAPFIEYLDRLRLKADGSIGVNDLPF